ncbi:contractile injection system protein, VgrG/Pvc8 family [Paenibacillus cisolokensis]|uniref:phage late control D family protein n=1 Tax=Paenibacillus cisolokensis TaxID=1658519 RepID=UPI003D2CE84D
MSRYTEIEIKYQGVNISRDIAPFLTSLTYTDNGNGRADDLNISLSDREGRWRGPWIPKRGEKIEASIILHNWQFDGKKRALKCGTFEVDTINFSGPPDTVDIQAVSYPGNARIKNERHTKSWEKVTLKQIGSRIAASAGMKFMFEASDVNFDRIDQTDETDIVFLNRLVEQEGCSLKVVNGAVVIYDDRKYENMKPVRTLTRGESDILSYSFELQTVDVSYAACQISYQDSSKKRTIKGTFRAPGATGPTLKINERVASEAEAIRKARNALRQRNKEAQRARLTLMGDYALVQGVTVQLAGFGAFDNKYFVETATHSVGVGGYTTQLEIRKVLGY